MKKKIIILSLFLPQWNPFQIFPLLPMFKGYLTHHDFNVKTVDANIKFYHWLLSEDFLQLLELHISSYVKENPVTGQCREAIEHLQSVISEPKQIFDLINSIRKKEVFDDERQRNHILNTWEKYLSSISTLFSPMQLSYRGLKFDLPKHPQAIIDYCQSEKGSLFRLFYSHVLFDQIADLAPDVITIFIISNEQLLPSLIFCHLIKRFFPQIHLCVGAPLLVEHFKTAPGFEQLLPQEIDSPVIGYHFEPFLELLQALEHHRPIPDHPYLLRNIDQEKHKLMAREATFPEKGYPKDYSDLEPADYFHNSSI
ncbi:hypothetical protein L3081_25415 [Colwellia sp. MSW7]|uniref:Uncharacterized protein n=1 Tax=Colwellia maritima TaxID=2912588 RepID=A0ABS9XAX1_9GAMM|nr:hypothetical protein [Colwellia maritima]MCI2286157.1 hypothetical protein [Colwellia maritima]